jgi:putative protease
LAAVARAIEAGADAVYFGLHHFTARAKVGFSLEELPEALRTLHRRGVKGLRHLQHAGVRQRARRSMPGARGDRGSRRRCDHRAGHRRAEAGAEIAPDLEIHASTQMSVASADGVRLAQSMGRAA